MVYVETAIPRGVDPGAWLEGLGSDDGGLMMLVWILPLVLFVFYGQRIQLQITSAEIQKSIRELDSLRAAARSQLFEYVRGRTGADHGDLLDRHISGFAIQPVGIDPAGLVGKLRHVLRARRDDARRSVDSLGMGEVESERAQTLLEAASALRASYMAVNHMFLTAKKQRNYPLILPLQMVLPSVMEEARALGAGLRAFERGQPVGDGIGPLVLARMMRGLEKTEPAPQTSMAVASIGGRRALLLKARGPGPTVGRLDEAARSAFEGGLDAVITVDAALRYEGQESALVEEGFGVAMGGSGTERFAIEEAATKAGVPVIAVVVRQSVREAVTLMTRQIAESADEAAERVRRAVERSAGPGGTVLVVGVGNTSGVPQ